MSRRSLVMGVVTAVFLPIVFSHPGFALTSKDCRARYKAAQAAGLVNGIPWEEYEQEEYEHLMCSGPSTTISNVKPQKRKISTTEDHASSGGKTDPTVDPKSALTTVAPIK